MTTFTNFCRTCDHQHIVDDTSSGDSVCVDCGLVLDKIYLHQAKNTYSHSNDNKRNSGALAQDSFEIIERMCSKCNIESEDIKNSIYNKWRNFDKKVRGSNFCLESSILVCIYTGLIEAKVPRPLSHLCGQTNVDIKNVWHHLKGNDAFYRPNLMCEYFLHSLNLTFRDVEGIRALVKQIENKFVFSQKTLIASCAYIFLRRKETTSKKQITISRLAKRLGISTMAICRCVKKIEKK